MNKSEKKIYFLFILISSTFVILTTNYLSLFDIINKANQTDVISYVEIANKSPSLPFKSKIIIQHVAQRFSVPYFIGLFSNLFNYELFYVFKIFTFIFIIFYIFLINLFIKKLNLNLKISVLFFSVLFLNPYIVRYHIFNPVQAHDMLFFCLGLIFAISFINKNYLINLITTLISLYLRQTSIAFFIGSCIFLSINRKFKFLLLLIIFYSLSLYLLLKIGGYISINTFPVNVAYEIILYDFSQIEKLVKFLLLAFMPFFPLIIFIFGQINKNIKISIILMLLFVCSMMIGQPILGGPDGTGNNVGRIANLCYPLVAVLCFYIFNFEKFVKNNYFYYSFIIGMFIWSLHPTFSIIKIFGIFRFYNF